MISPKTQFFFVVVLSACRLSASEAYYKVTIQNELFCKAFLNVPNPKLLTNQSPYPYVTERTTETFLIHEDEKSNQTLVFPNGWPANTVTLPIDKHSTSFTIKKDPTEVQKVIVEESESKKIIAEILILANQK
jgi:hypothetical protein